MSVSSLSLSTLNSSSKIYVADQDNATLDTAPRSQRSTLSTSVPLPVFSPVKLRKTMSDYHRRNSLNQNAKSGVSVNHRRLVHGGTAMQLSIYGDECITVEFVPLGSMSQRLMKSISETTSPTSISSVLELTKLVSCTLLFSTLITALPYFLVPFPDPYSSFAPSIPFIFISLPFACMTIFTGIALFLTHLAAAPLPMRNILIASLAGTVAMISVTFIGGEFFGVYPIPWAAITAATPGVQAVLVALYFQYPQALRTKPLFRKAFSKALAIALLNIFTVTVLVFYNSLFRSLSPNKQSVAALALPAIKFVVKACSKRLTRSTNPEFIHGAGFYIDSCVGAISTVIFTSIKDPLAFTAIVLIDLVENAVFIALMLIFLVHDLDWGLRQALDKLESEEEEGAGVDEIEGKKLAASAAKGSFLASVESEERAVDPSDEYDDQTPPAIALLRDAVKLASTTSLNPRVAFLCGNLFFSELVEFTLPIIMASASTLIYYNPFNKNCQFLEYMNEKDEADFIRGMKYVFIDAVIQLVFMVAQMMFLHHYLRIDVLRVGLFLLKKTPHYFFWMSACACSYFIAIYLAHCGSDTNLTFTFSWIRDPDGEGANYLPGVNATVWESGGRCQIFLDKHEEDMESLGNATCFADPCQEWWMEELS